MPLISYGRLKVRGQNGQKGMNNEHTLSVLNPLLDPNQLILGHGWNWHLHIPLEHTKHASPDYEEIANLLHSLGI